MPNDLGKYMRGQLPEAVETALKDLRSEAITQGWEGVNERNLQYANDAVRAAISKAIATARAEAEKRERERILEQLYKLTTARCNVYTEVPSTIDVVVSRDAVHSMIESIQKGNHAE